MEVSCYKTGLINDTMISSGTIKKKNSRQCHILAKKNITSLRFSGLHVIS